MPWSRLRWAYGLLETVTQVDVPHSPSRIHDLSSGGTANAGVTREVTLTVEGLRLGDDTRLPAAFDVPPYEVLAQQPARLRDRGAALEVGG